MQKPEYLIIKQQLTFTKPLWITLAVVAFDWLLIYAAFLLMGAGGWAFIASQALLALVYFHHFALLHEAGHGNIHEKRWVNTLVGHYASILCFMPFFCWKHIHQGHHVWVGNIDKDPTMRPIRKMKDSGKFPAVLRVTWLSWLPLPAFVQHSILWYYPIRLWREKDGALLPCLYSVLFLACAYIVLFTAFPAWVNVDNLWLSFLFYLIFTELENLPHHANTPMFRNSPARTKLQLWEQYVSSRSCNLPPIVSELLVLNFNFHTEHHFFPNLPWHRLRKARALLKPALEDAYTEVAGLRWNLKNRRRDAKDIWLSDVPHPLLPHNPLS